MKKKAPKSASAKKTQPSIAKKTNKTNAMERMLNTPKTAPQKPAAKKAKPKTTAATASNKSAPSTKKSTARKASVPKAEATKANVVKTGTTKIPVKRAIEKKSVTKSTRNTAKKKAAKKNTAKKNAAKKDTANANKNTSDNSAGPSTNNMLDEAKKLHAEMYAKMLDDARKVARVEARAEVQRLAQHWQANPGNWSNNNMAEPTLSGGTTLNPDPFAESHARPSGTASLRVTPSIRARRVKQTARRTICNAAPSPSAEGGYSAQLSRNSLGANRTENSEEVWVVTHEAGYIPDGFHSWEPPRRRDVGAFTSRADAVKEGKRLVGDDVGYTWSELCEGGELEVVEDSSHKWEVCWSPPDSEFSRIVALRVKVNEGRWLVETESGICTDEFRSRVDTTKKTLGPYQSRAIAVGMGKRHMSQVCGICWDEVVSEGHLKTVADSCIRWEVVWSPPDLEWSRVVAKLIGAERARTDGNHSAEDMEVEEDEDDDEFIGMHVTAAF